MEVQQIGKNGRGVYIDWPGKGWKETATKLIELIDAGATVVINYDNGKKLTLKDGDPNAEGKVVDQNNNPITKKTLVAALNPLVKNDKREAVLSAIKNATKNQVLKDKTVVISKTDGKVEVKIESPPPPPPPNETQELQEMREFIEETGRKPMVVSKKEQTHQLLSILDFIGRLGIMLGVVSNSATYDLSGKLTVSDLQAAEIVDKGGELTEKGEALLKFANSLGVKLAEIAIANQQWQFNMSQQSTGSIANPFLPFVEAASELQTSGLVIHLDEDPLSNKEAVTKVLSFSAKQVMPTKCITANVVLDTLLGRNPQPTNSSPSPTPICNPLHSISTTVLAATSPTINTINKLEAALEEKLGVAVKVVTDPLFDPSHGALPISGPQVLVIIIPEAMKRDAERLQQLHTDLDVKKGQIQYKGQALSPATLEAVYEEGGKIKLQWKVPAVDGTTAAIPLERSVIDDVSVLDPDMKKWVNSNEKEKEEGKTVKNSIGDDGVIRLSPKEEDTDSFSLWKKGTEYILMVKIADQEIPLRFTPTDEPPTTRVAKGKGGGSRGKSENKAAGGTTTRVKKAARRKGGGSRGTSEKRTSTAAVAEENGGGDGGTSGGKRMSMTTW